MEERLVNPFEPESTDFSHTSRTSSVFSKRLSREQKRLATLIGIGSVTGIVMGVLITTMLWRPQVIVRPLNSGLSTIASFSKIFFASSGQPSVKGVISATATDGEKYYAVFLTNNQVYFGKLSRLDTPTPLLRDVYYLRVQQPLQESTNPEGDEASRKKKQEEPPSFPSSEMTLIKLGNELHGPMDEIKLNRDHVLFVEELKDDSRVVQAIRDYQKRQATGQ